MGYKSRGGWSIPVCLRDCRNRDIDCDECFGFSCFSPNIPVDLVGKTENVKRMSEKDGFQCA